MTAVDLIIRNGRIINPSNGVDRVGDIAIGDGYIQSIGSNLQIQSIQEFDATGCLVTPGLIDGHVHCYQYATPLGIDPDVDCLPRGVTTVVDAGSSGCSTFLGLRKYVAERSRTRVLCFLHLVAHGLASSGCASGAPGGELDSLNTASVRDCVESVNGNRDMIVGVKLRLSDSIADEGRNEQEAFRRSLQVAESCKVPLMIHHTLSTVPTQITDTDEGILGCPRHMRPGDIYTHTYQGYRSTIIDPQSQTIYPDVTDAKSRGVLFDVGHGQGSFSWTVGEICARKNFWPDIISTDLHTGNVAGPAYDLPTVMSKFLHLGMPLVDVIRAVTHMPAKAIGWEDRIGSLGIGREADVTVLKLEDYNDDMEDSQSQVRHVQRIFRPVAVWRHGIPHEISRPQKQPNVDAMVANSKEWEKLKIRDVDPPKCKP